MDVWLFDAQHNLPGDSDAIKKVVDKTHIVYEGVNVTGAQHEQSGDQLKESTMSSFLHSKARQCVCVLALTVNSKAGIGVQRVT